MLLKTELHVHGVLTTDMQLTGGQHGSTTNTLHSKDPNPITQLSGEFFILGFFIPAFSVWLINSYYVLL